MKKNNNHLLCFLSKIPKIVYTILAIGAVLVSVTMAYAAVNYRSKENSKRIETIEEKTQANQQAIIAIQTKLEYIIIGINEIKDELKNGKK